MSKTQYEQKVVTIGGGTGHFHLLNGLKKYNHPSLITAIVATWDTGGSSGRLRTELGVLPPGDIRRCLLALMEDENQQKVAQTLFDDRLDGFNGFLKGHSLGNLLGVRLDNIFRGQDRGTDAQRALFRIRARILPVSLSDIQLIGVTRNGLNIEGETNLDYRCKRPDFDPEDKIVRIYFNTRADPNPEAIKSIKEADKIIFAPGDLFTSILPHLLVDGIKEAINESNAKLCIIINLMTKPGETDSFKASDFLEKVTYYLGNNKRIDYLIINGEKYDKDIVEIYKSEGQEMVLFDEAKCVKVAPNAKIIKAKIAKYLRKDHLLRHDSNRLAKTILQLT